MPLVTGIGTSAFASVWTGTATAVKVKNPAANTGNLKVYVPGAHAGGSAADHDVLEPGDTGLYRGGYNHVTDVLIQGASGATSAIVAPVSRTDNSDQ